MGPVARARTAVSSSLPFVLSILACLVAAGSASATTYTITSGTSLVTATVGVTPVGAGTINFNGSFVEFVTSPSPAVVDLELTASTQGPYSITLPLPFPDYEKITINSLLIQPGGSFASSGSGTNPYSFTVTGLEVSGVVTLSDDDNILPLIVSPFLVPNSAFTGSVTLGLGGQLSLSGIELAVLDVDGPGGLPPIVLKADNLIQAIPEPGTILLLGMGVAGLAAQSRRTR